MQNRQPTDSVGRQLRIGDRVRWRGEVYTIAGFREGAGMFCTTDFVEPRHLTEEPDEMSVDLVTPAAAFFDASSREEKNARLAVQMGVGATGEAPRGGREGDRGGLKAALCREGDEIVVYFGKPVGWLSMTPAEAVAFGRALVAQAEKGA